jgi:glutamate receptor, anionic
VRARRVFPQKPLMRPELMMSRDKMSQIIHQAPPMEKNSCWKSWMSKFPTRSKRIDVISRILFPMVFAMFNMSYWSTYLFREGVDEDK